MNSNTSNRTPNKNPWITVTELRLGREEPVEDEESALSSTSTSDQQTPPPNTPLGPLFGAHSPAFMIGWRPGHYIHCSSGCSTDCSSPSQRAPRSLKQSHLANSNAQNSSSSKFQVDPGPRLDIWLESVNSYNEELPQEDFVCGETDLTINSEKQEESPIKNQAECSIIKFTPKETKKQREQGGGTEKQNKNTQQHQTEQLKRSGSEYRQINNPEIDEDAISDLDLTETSDKNPI